MFETTDRSANDCFDNRMTSTYVNFPHLTKPAPDQMMHRITCQKWQGFALPLPTWREEEVSTFAGALPAWFPSGLIATAEYGEENSRHGQ